MSIRYLDFSGAVNFWTNIKNYILSKIPTKTSELTNDSGFLTQHQSLSNYVTLNSEQTITGKKLFTNSTTKVNSVNTFTGSTQFIDLSTTVPRGKFPESGHRVGRVYIGDNTSYNGSWFIIDPTIDTDKAYYRMVTTNPDNTDSTRFSITWDSTKEGARRRRLACMGDLICATNNTYQIGESGNVWKDAYINNIHGISDYTNFLVKVLNFTTTLTHAVSGRRTVVCEGAITLTLPAPEEGSWFHIKATTERVILNFANGVSVSGVDGIPITLKPNESILLCYYTASSYVAFCNFKRCGVIGRTGNAPSEPKNWFKVAECTLTETYIDPFICLRVFESTTGNTIGTLCAHCRINNTIGVVDTSNCYLQWQDAGAGIDLSKYALTTNETSGTGVTITLWCTLVGGYSSLKFEVVTECKRNDHPNNNTWKITRDRQADGDLAELSDTDFTKIVYSTLTTLKNNTTGTASNVTGTVAIANGGTGATTRLSAIKNLTNESVGTPTHFLAITTNYAKAGYTSVAQAKTVLGITGDIVSHNASEFLTSHQSLANYVTTNTSQSISGIKTFPTNINLANTSTSQREYWSLKFSKTDTNGTGASQIGVYQPSNSNDFVACLRLGNPRGDNKPTTGTDVNTGNCWSGIGVYYNYELNRGYPYAPSCTSWSDSSNSALELASTEWVRRYCETTKNFVTNSSLSSASVASASEFSTNKDVTLTGDVTGTASSKAGWSVATTLANSGVTAGTYGPSADVTGSNNATILVPEITVDAKGRVTAVTNRTYTSVNTDSDKKVYQYYKSDDNVYRLLFSNNAGNTATSNVGAAYSGLNNSLYVNPSTGALYATKLYSNGVEVLTAHQSLSNYVTLNTAQEITNTKTFKDATTVRKLTSVEAGNVIPTSDKLISDIWQDKNGKELGRIFYYKNTSGNTALCLRAGDWFSESEGVYSLNASGTNRRAELHLYSDSSGNCCIKPVGYFSATLKALSTSVWLGESTKPFGRVYANAFEFCNAGLLPDTDVQTTEEHSIGFFGQNNTPLSYITFQKRPNLKDRVAIRIQTASSSYKSYDFDATCFYPESSNSVDIGSTTNIFKNIYCNNYYKGTTAFGDIVTHNASEFLTSHQSLSSCVKNVVTNNQTIKSTGITRGTAPSSTQTFGIAFTDNNAKYIGNVYGAFATDKSTFVGLYAYKGSTTSNGDNASVRVGYDASGNAYTYAPTPATADNSTQIATTAFVKAQGYLTSHQSLANYVTTNTDQSISGIKSHSKHISILGDYIGDEASTNARSCLYLKANRDTDGKSGLYVTKFRTNVAQGSMGDLSVVFLSHDILENETRTNAGFVESYSNWENDVPGGMSIYSSIATRNLGTSAKPWTNAYITNLNLNGNAFDPTSTDGVGTVKLLAYAPTSDQEYSLNAGTTKAGSKLGEVWASYNGTMSTELHWGISMSKTQSGTWKLLHYISVAGGTDNLKLIGLWVRIS